MKKEEEGAELGVYFAWMSTPEEKANQKACLFSKRSEWAFLAPSGSAVSLRNKANNKHSCWHDSPGFKRRLNSCFFLLPLLPLPSHQVMCHSPADRGHCLECPEVRPSAILYILPIQYSWWSHLTVRKPWCFTKKHSQKERKHCDTRNSGQGIILSILHYFWEGPIWGG